MVMTLAREQIQRAGMPFAILLIAIIIFVIGGIGPNIGLAVLAISVLLIGASLLWRPGEPPILLAVVGVQWLQASLSIFHANVLDKAVNDTDTVGGDLEKAILLSELALLALIIGMRLGAGSWSPKVSISTKSVAASYPVSVFFRLYCVAFGAGVIAGILASKIAALSQPLLAASELRWAFFWMLGYVTFTKKGGAKHYFLAAFALELAWGVGGFFSDFKTVFIVTLLAAAAANVRISPAAGIGLGLLMATLLIFGVVWSVIKPDYRSFVSGGETAQVVTVGVSERLDKLKELIGALDSEALSDGLDRLVHRVTYVEFFGAVMEYVPKVIPHEDGALWWDAVSRPLMPRMFFPEKGIIDDSMRTAYYTGLHITGMEKGTSISIGYIGESYIDFGEEGMLVPIFLLGFFYGRVYRWLINRTQSRGLLGMGLASTIFMGGLFLETSITKLFGGLVIMLVVAWLVTRFIIPRVCPWMQANYVS